MPDKLSRENIFNPQQQQSVTAQVQSQSQMPINNVLRDDFGWDVPIESAPLPSGGRVYNKNSTLYGRKTLDIRAMTAKDEDILMSQAYIKQGNVISKLLESCIIDKSIDINEMLVGDRNAVMISIRITGFGAQYKTTVLCEHCMTSQSASFNLSDLGLKRLGSDPLSDGENKFSVELPVTKKTVYFSLTTVNSEDEAIISAKRNKDLLGIDHDQSRVTSSLLNTVIAIDNISDKNKIKKFIQNMPVLDSRFLRNHIKEIEPGIDMAATLVCTSCQRGSQVNLPLGTGFFWPDL